VPVSFGLITADTVEQAEARTRPPLDRGREAARAAVSMAQVVALVRADAARRA
jgi:6,7-dimethyl-8-ribityllumazine synthase